jgi:hypothetical protein
MVALKLLQPLLGFVELPLQLQRLAIAQPCRRLQIGLALRLLDLHLERLHLLLHTWIA